MSRKHYFKADARSCVFHRYGVTNCTCKSNPFWFCIGSKKCANFRLNPIKNYKGK